MLYTLAWILIIYVCYSLCDGDTVSLVNNERYSVARDRRFLLYDVNHGEGFNLRRDVYMRIANAVRLLRKAGEPFILVLPPWGGLYHWKQPNVRLKWSEFFDVKSLNEFVPVLEFEDYLQEYGTLIDQVVYLQHYKEGWSDDYILKYDRRECIEGSRFYRREGHLWRGWFFSYDEVRAKKFECISIQGDSETLKKLILNQYPETSSIFIDRGEAILHQHYGDVHYWQARRSMRYAKHLVEIGDFFRESQLESTDEQDRTQLAVSRNDVKNRDAIGGNFLCAHWRRRDFVRAHGDELPSINGAAKQLNDLCEKARVTRIFLATDASESEVEQLSAMLRVPVLRFKNSTLPDGAVAIIDQWICAHARVFVGSHVSTFSYRIQEDREILGFAPNTTFNRLCPDKLNNCEQPAKWTIVYE
ncbi:unnamed protein product [Angiostrongylus costaricensis]|uniref:GDP-fucose protein O-fucosyltransferase 2 n=1 Tax=Angiostrongylus costaricensis TaxID=334426 RepID=A0A158PJ28_ANGCS|nr:unnamed protein product [Angiostrongylus costaricensis]